jgi:prophage antirepressor-like protein
MEIRHDEWHGNDIRFVDVNGEWYAVLKDVCDALGINNPSLVRYRIPLRYLEKVTISDRDSVTGASDVYSTKVTSRARHSQTMLVVNNRGIYHAFLGSRKLEAQKFVEWMIGVIEREQGKQGYEDYETMSFAEDKAAEDPRTDEDIINQHVDDIWKMREWGEDKWWIEYEEGRFIELKQYVDEFCPEELAEEIYLRAYRKFGGQC